MDILVTTKFRKTRFVVIYRPESTNKNKYTMSEFYTEFTEIVAHYFLDKEEVIFCGDFNFHVNKPDEIKVKKFQEILNTFDFVQQVTKPTHISGNTLDLIITKKESSLIYHKVDSMLSDHYNIIMKLDNTKPPPVQKLITFRNIKGINKEEFKQDISFNMAEVNYSQNLETLVTSYNEKLGEILDKHAPKQTKLVTIRNPTPWNTEEIRPEKRNRRRLESKWRKSKLEVDLQAYKTQKKKYNDMLNQKRSDYYSELVKQNAGDPKSLFKVINSALHRKEDTPLPSDVPDQILANDFSEYFDCKITNIRNELDRTEQNNEMSNQVPLSHEASKYSSILGEFRSLTEDEVKKLIKDSSNKQCDLDTLPTWLLKECIEDILPLITKITKIVITPWRCTYITEKGYN
jgi:hypothetical protein